MNKIPELLTNEQIYSTRILITLFIEWRTYCRSLAPSNLNYGQTQAKTEKDKNSISFVGSKVWRDVPGDIKPFLAEVLILIHSIINLQINTYKPWGRGLLSRLFYSFFFFFFIFSVVSLLMFCMGVTEPNWFS